MMARRIRRSAALVCLLALCALRLRMARLRGPLTLERRAEWMQQSARTILGALGIHLAIEGQPPARGLVVSNHLGYFDIVVYAAAMPCSFISKAEIGQWPFFGSLARAGATLFLDRQKHASADAVAAELAGRLTSRIPILLFPEGTSTDGGQVLHFHARLFQPAIDAQATVTEAAIGYRLDGGSEERSICWYGDAAFLPHLWKTLGVRRINAHICFGRPQIYTDARDAARLAQASIEDMRTEMNAAGSRQPSTVSAEQALVSR